MKTAQFSMNSIIFSVFLIFNQFLSAGQDIVQEFEENVGQFINNVQDRDFQSVQKSFYDLNYAQVKKNYETSYTNEFEFTILKICIFSLFDGSADYEEKNALLIMQFLFDHGFIVNYIGEQDLYAEVSSSPLKTGNLLHFSANLYVQFFIFLSEMIKVGQPDLFKKSPELLEIDAILLYMMQELLDRSIDRTSQGMMHGVPGQENNVTVLEFLNLEKEFIKTAQVSDDFWVSIQDVYSCKLNIRQFSDYKKAVIARIDNLIKFLA